MKRILSEYYPLSRAEFSTLWEKATFVFDTNVLLHLYRLPSEARDEFLKTLELLKKKNRIWIPHQVALEFQLRRVKVIDDEYEKTKKYSSDAAGVVDDIKEFISALELEKRGLKAESETLRKELEKVHSQLEKLVKTAHDQQPEVSASDRIRDRIDKIIDDCVGDAPKSQAELDLLITGAEERYNLKVPPGYMDEAKARKEGEASFVYDEMLYQRKYGDLILWRQTLNYVESSGVEFLILVTADKKEDWWWMHKSRTLGPRPELAKEIRRKGAKLFWMYPTEVFLKLAGDHLEATISERTLMEVKSFSEEYNVARKMQFSSIDDERLMFPSVRHFESREETVSSIVRIWLAKRYGLEVVGQIGFPDFVIDVGDAKLGFELRVIRDFKRQIFSRSTIDAMLRGYLETKEGRLGEFSLIVVTSGDFLDSEEDIDQFSNRVTELLIRYPITAIIVGYIRDGKFISLFTGGNRDSRCLEF